MNFKFLLTIQIISSLILSIPAFAEIKTVTHTLKQPFGGSQSPDDARIAGIARAKREALEQFGTYIESTTVVKNAQVDSDEILALTAGVTKAEVIKQKNYADGDAFGIEITVKVELDTAVLEKSLKRLLEDRNHLKNLKEAREREKMLLTQIADLEKQNQKMGKTKQQAAKLKKEFKVASQGLTAVDWFDMAVALYDGKKDADPKKVIKYYTQAIKLDPSYSKAYTNRGCIHSEIKQPELAIADFNQAISIDPQDVLAFSNRGAVYGSLKQTGRAIADYDKAIQLDPSYVTAYHNRGRKFFEIGQIERAIADFDQAIRIDPKYAIAYVDRGVVFNKLMQPERAIADFDQAIQLDPDYAMAYCNLGYTYANMDQIDRAIANFDQALLIDPKLIVAYVGRAASYLKLNDRQIACADVKKACKLGSCGAYKMLVKDKLCK